MATEINAATSLSPYFDYDQTWTYHEDGHSVTVQGLLVNVDHSWVTIDLKSTKRFKSFLLDDTSERDLERLGRLGYAIFRTTWGLYVNPPPYCTILSIEPLSAAEEKVKARKELAAEFNLNRSSLRYWQGQYKKTCAAGIRKRDAENKRRMAEQARAALALLDVVEKV